MQGETAVSPYTPRQIHPTFEANCRLPFRLLFIYCPGAFHLVTHVTQLLWRKPQGFLSDRAIIQRSIKPLGFAVRFIW